VEPPIEEMVHSFGTEKFLAREPLGTIFAAKSKWGNQTTG
jgi:hypothetical protein